MYLRSISAFPKRLWLICASGLVVVLVLAAGGGVLALYDRNGNGSDVVTASDLFPHFEREPTEADAHPMDENHPMIERSEVRNSRLIGETEFGRYFITEATGPNGEDAVCIINLEIGGGCDFLESVLERGLMQSLYDGHERVVKMARILPADGYSEVYNEDGDYLGEVEGRLWDGQFSAGDQPETLIFRGEAGELEVPGWSSDRKFDDDGRLTTLPENQN